MFELSDSAGMLLLVAGTLLYQFISRYLTTLSHRFGIEPSELFSVLCARANKAVGKEANLICLSPLFGLAERSLLSVRSPAAPMDHCTCTRVCTVYALRMHYTCRFAAGQSDGSLVCTWPRCASPGWSRQTRRNRRQRTHRGRSAGCCCACSWCGRLSRRSSPSRSRGGPIARSTY